LSGVLELEDRLDARRAARLSAFVAAVRRRRFDAAVFFSRSDTRAFLAALAGIRRRHGFKPPYGNRFLTHGYDAPASPLHRTDEFLYLCRQMGVPPDGRWPEFTPAHEAEAAALRLLSELGLPQGKPYAAVHAGGNWLLKRWPAERFAEWAGQFREATSNAVELVFIGSRGEEALVERIRSMAGARGLLSVCGRTDLDMLAWLLRGAKFLLSNDSGPIHLAASQGTPIVGVFGPTLPERTGPLGRAFVRIARRDPGCEIPCYFRECSDRVCMEAVTAEEVLGMTLEAAR
jgi:heptosyltransferase-2